MTSTTNVYIPGVGITLTRANIVLEQQRRAERKEAPATPDEIVAAFCRNPTHRHHVRATYLMQPRTEKTHAP